MAPGSLKTSHFYVLFLTAEQNTARGFFLAKHGIERNYFSQVQFLHLDNAIGFLSHPEWKKKTYNSGSATS